MLPLPPTVGSLRDGNRPGRIPSLSHYCYRYINSHLDSIQSLGNLPYSLCEPFLRNCSTEQLLILEKNSPHLVHEDQLVWQSFCFRDFRRWEIQYKNGEIPEPFCWRDQYFSCRHDEEKRLEEVRMRVRNRRQEVVEEKKGRQVIVTDKLPPAKRTRFNIAPSRPKTLFEKTKAESLKLQRLVYGRPTLSSPAIKPKPSPQSKTSTQSKTTAPITPSSLLPIKKTTATRVGAPENAEQFPPQSPPKPTGLPGPVGAVSPKKDPMSTLFMPKHRAHSQLPGSPSVTTHRK